VQNNQATIKQFTHSMAIADSSEVFATDSLLWNGDSLQAVDTVKIRNFTYDSLATLKDPDPKLNLKIQFRQQPVADWEIIISVLIFILLATIRVSSDTYLERLFTAIFNRVAFARLYREKIADTIFNIHFRLSFLYYINISYVAYFAFNQFDITNGLHGLLLYLALLLLIYVLVELKASLYRFGGWIFGTSEVMDEFVYYMISGNRAAGVALTPVVLLMMLQSGLAGELALALGVVVVGFTYVNTLIKGFWTIAQKVFSVSYLILYLCTLEILPLLVLLRLAIGI
jgi:hypothetical protein